MYKIIFNQDNKQYQILQDNQEVFSVEFQEDIDQIIIKTPKEVFAGPINLISFKEDLTK